MKLSDLIENLIGAEIEWRKAIEDGDRPFAVIESRKSIELLKEKIDRLNPSASPRKTTKKNV